MTIARNRQICLEETPYYHCISRCVRRAFLCGKDRLTGKSFEHRRGWIEQCMLAQSEAFCIDIAGYAILSNHYHVILRVDSERAASLTQNEVIDRWSTLYKIPSWVQQFRDAEIPGPAQQSRIDVQIEQWRGVLTSISRWMGYLNEHIAREANKEDGCRGRFWEGRFKSQALLDEAALIQCMVYVDLNPVRAGIATTPETSPFTSIKRRLDDRQSEQPETGGLMGFSVAGTRQQSSTNTLPIEFEAYLELLDWSGRITRTGSRGFIPDSVPSILDRLGIDSKDWAYGMKPSSFRGRTALGSVERLRSWCEALGRCWVWGMSARPT